jgi:hypothetical protein
MRLGGFEPPTNGLEGRRSSAELQAPTGSVALVNVGQTRFVAAADMWAAATARRGHTKPVKVVMAAKRPDFRRRAVALPLSYRRLRKA